MDTAPGRLPNSTEVRTAQIHGARGRATGDTGDTLCYSASAGDFDGDGLTDLITNEMVGNGLAPGTIDVGNLVALGGALLSDLAPPLYFAQFGNGAGFRSDVIATNPSDSLTATAIFDIRDDDGLPMPIAVALTNIEGGVLAGTSIDSTFEATIPPLGGVVLSTDGEGEIQVGSVSVLSNLTLGGVIRFEAPSSGIAGVGAGSPLRRFLSPVRFQDGINTGLALQNPSEIEVTVELRLRTLDGTELPDDTGRAIVTLPPRGHTARFITELFPDADLANFEGTLSAESADPVVAVAIEQGQQPGEFTTLPVTPRQ